MNKSVQRHTNSTLATVKVSEETLLFFKGCSLDGNSGPRAPPGFFFIIYIYSAFSV